MTIKTGKSLLRLIKGQKILCRITIPKFYLSFHIVHYICAS
jgi:hypothetical protein